MTQRSGRLTLHPLRPGVRLMRRLRLPAKLSLLALMLLVPLLGLVAWTIVHQLDELRTVRRELGGAEQAAALIETVSALQAHRALALRALSGDGQARAAQPQAARQLREALARAEAPTPNNAQPAWSPEWPATRQAIAQLADGQGPTQRDALTEAHTRAVARLRDELLGIGERSGLLLDPVASTFFLMDLTIERMVPWLEALSTAQAHGSALLARGDASARERGAMIGRAEAIRQQVHEIGVRLAALQRSGEEAPAGWPAARDAALALAQQSADVFSAEVLDADAARFEAEAGKAIQAVLNMKTQTVERMVSLLQGREADDLRLLLMALGISALGLSSTLYLSVAFYSSFRGALTMLHKAVAAAAAGDLSHKVDIRGQDELAQMGTLMESMYVRLSAMVAEIRSSAVRVGMSGQQVSQSSQSLALRTDAQAASLRQTVGSVGQLSEVAASNASAAGALDQLTEGLRQQAEQGGQSMREVVKAMGELEESSIRMAEIIGVIDGIAFQTNILALNAAVEAARAGEAGRGFAVVAAEVRQLAQRSAAAAGEIRSLIARSTEQVDASVKQTRQVGRSLDTLVSGVRQVSGTLRGIAQASARQSSELEEVSKSVGSLDEITRDNAAMVVDSTQASHDLVDRAERLSKAVSSIRLRQGSADEAHDLVDRALALIAQLGYAPATEQLHSREAGFVDRDLYVFVIDRQGHYRVHGAKPAMEGRLVHEVPGIDGDRFVRDAWAAAPEGGWIDYDIVNPETGKVQPKASYVKALDDQLLVGCGVYRQQDPVLAG